MRSVLKLFLGSILLFQAILAKGQGDALEGFATGGCGSDAMLKNARKTAAYRTKEDQMNRQILLSEPVLQDVQFTLPIVFHIIADNPELTSDLDIQNALKDLNDAFGKAGNYAASNGVDTKIRFCLAQNDPDGGITTGITRTVSLYGDDLNKSIEDARIKNLVQWDPAHYINIWYVKNIRDENFVFWTCEKSGPQWTRIGTEGYATMPPPGDFDGIVVSRFQEILAHEMGHYLGLYHTFEKGCGNNDCTTNGDRVCDTPPDNSFIPSSCTNPGNSCRTDTLSNYSNGYFKEDVPDQVTNFMDYGNFGCSNEFTEGQAARMRAAIKTQRNDLLVNKCDKPCGQDIVALFTRDISYPVTGDNINFTNKSAGGSKFEWLIDNIVVSISSDFTYQFKEAGKYKVSLKSFNNPGCFGIYTDYIIVSCGVTARFYTDKQQIASQAGMVTDSILFTNTSQNASAFQWLISNDNGMAEQTVSTGKDLSYTFPEPANYYIRLIASNGSCADTTEIYNAFVLNPVPDVTPRIYSVDCYDQTKVQVRFGICSSGYMPIPAGLPISFFDADPLEPGAKKLGTTFTLPDTVRGSCCSETFMEILDVKKPGLNQIYMAFNDDGNKVPIDPGSNLPVERNYKNNITSKSGFAYNIQVIPENSILEPGDAIKIIANANGAPTIAETVFNWSPAKNLSCSICDSTILVADSSTVKEVIGVSEYGCRDTALVTINVPPAYDYSISIDTIKCGGDIDSVFVSFTIINNFKRDFLPKGLTVAFYDGDPASTNAAFVKPLFILPNTLSQRQATFTTAIKIPDADTTYAVVNDNGSTKPLKLPNTLFEEIDYSNNTDFFFFSPIKVKATNSGTVCEFDTIKLMAAASWPDATYKWTGPNGFSGTDQSAVLEGVTANMVGTYFATASRDGCRSNPAGTKISVKLSPAVTAETRDTVCEGAPLYLFATSTGNNKYKWSGPSGFTSTLQNPIIQNASAETSGTYRVVATGTGNCSSAPSGLLVKVHALPIPDFNGSDVCLPATTAFFTDKSTINEGNISTYLWNFGDPASNASNTSTDKNPEHQFSAGGKYPVSLKVTSEDGCSSIKNNLYAGIHTQPTAVFTISSLQGTCVNEAVTFTDKSIADGTAILKWTWDPGDESPLIIQNNTALPVNHIYTKSGIYTIGLTVTNNFDCEDNAVQTVTILPPPDINAGPDLLVLEGGTTILRATAASPGLKYLWTPAPYLSSTTILNPTVSRPLDDVLYVLTATDEHFCKTSDEVVVKLLRKITIPNAFSPNGDGINDVWNIRYLNDYPGCTVNIFDRYGQLIFKSVGYNKPWDGTRNGSPLATGVYYYIITPNNGVEHLNGSITLIR